MTIVEVDPKGSLFNIYNTEVLGKAQLLLLDYYTLPLIRTLKYWVIIKVVSSTIFGVFGVTRPEIEPLSPEALTNTWPT